MSKAKSKHSIYKVLMKKLCPSYPVHLLEELIILTIK